MRLVFAVLALLPPLQETKDFKIHLQAKDGTAIGGTVKLPPVVTMKTRFGEIQVDTATIQQFRLNNDGKVWITTTTGNTIIGDSSIQKFEIEAPGGRLTVALAEVQFVTFEPPAPPPLPRPPPVAAPGPSVQPPAPAPARFRGIEVRKAYDSAKAYARGFDTILLLPDGKRAALLDYVSEECVFVNLADGTCERVKVEAGPSHLVEKAGKVYVANRKSNSLTVIDAATAKVTGRVAVGSSPRWMAAPTLGNVLYLITESDRAWLQSLDTRTGQMIGPMIHSQWNQGLFFSLGFVTVTPDNRLLITQAEQNVSPSATPSVYLINGQKITDLQVLHHEDHPGAFQMDYAGARVYAGTRVYSLDLRETVASSVPASLCLPHPTKNVVFGIKRLTRRWDDPATVITLFDELRMTVIGEINVGADILGLLPTESTLYALGRTFLYEIPLAGNVPAEALSKERERRIPLDLSRTPSDEDIRKAEGQIADGWKALDVGRVDAAKKAFDAALLLDPFSNAKAGLAEIQVRKKDFTGALPVLKGLVQYPFRNPSGRSLCYVALSEAYAGTSQQEPALRALQEGLLWDPKDPALLKSMGNAQAAAGNVRQNFVYWAKSLQADPKQPELKKQLDDLIKKIQISTTGTCENCKGDGKFETLVAEEGAGKKKITTECKTCRGLGKTWKRPCLECNGTGKTETNGTGRLGYGHYCENCWGSGYVTEPAKSNY